MRVMTFIRNSLFAIRGSSLFSTKNEKPKTKTDGLRHLSIDIPVLLRHGLWPELAFDRFACARQRASLVLQEMRNGLPQCDRLFARHDRDVGAEDAVQFEASGIIARQHGCAGRQGF